MNEIDTNELEQLLVEKYGEGYSSDNIKLLERNVSEDAFESAPGVKPYDLVLDEHYGPGNWAKLRRDETKPGHWEIVAYIEPQATALVSEEPSETMFDDDEVLWFKSDNLRAFTLVKGGLYNNKKGR